MTRDEKTGIAVGGIAGLLLWLYDSKHIVLGGSKHTPISDFIHSIIPIDAVCGIRMEGISILCDFFLTLLILTFAGIIVGYSATSIKQFIKK